MTAVTRKDSKRKLPAGVTPAYIDYNDESSIVAALKGQQFLVITLSAFAPPDTHSKLVKAAAKAGVPYIMPNVYGYDPMNTKLTEETGMRFGLGTLQEIESLGGPSYVALTCGFWYEWSLALGEQCYGFDIQARTATFFDDGKTKIDTSTWTLCGQTLAALLDLPISGASPSIADWKNKALYVASFKVNQRDMLDSLNRVLGTTDKDWTISYEPSAERYQKGLDSMKRGDRSGFAKAMYSRTFYPNGDADFESVHGLANDALGLPKENLDEATKRVVDMVTAGYNPWA